MPDFLDRIRQGIDRGVLAISTKSKALLEATHLRSQIRTLHNQRQEAIMQLGETAYSMLKQGHMDSARLQPYVATLQALDAKIATLQDQVRQIEIAAARLGAARTSSALAYCGFCGVPLQETSRFCPNCGKDVTAIIEHAKTQRQASTRACPSCGTTVEASSKFCPACGHALS